ncbi:hypothetical protein SDC9_200977 [bioreactor metagenome]|uniref:Uncharacterized protein n=1 Tax=bioreactor metagenome TaxID=1076179 RepID=A0A645J1I6_9ZZZZ
MVVHRLQGAQRSLVGVPQGKDMADYSADGDAKGHLGLMLQGLRQPESPFIQFLRRLPLEQHQDQPLKLAA